MARVPVDLIRRGLNMGNGPSRYESTQNRLFDMRRRLHLRLRDMTEDDLRRVSMCTFESMMMQLWREGHIWAGRMLTEFEQLDKVARKICMLVAPELRRGSLKKEKKLLRFLADELCSAEDAMNTGNCAVQCHHLLNLAEETASRGMSWWWLTERLLKEATAVVPRAKDDGEIEAKVALAKGVFLLDQLHESGEAVESLTNAIRLSEKREWLASTRLMMAFKSQFSPPPEGLSVFSLSKKASGTLEESDGVERSPEKPLLDSGTDTNPVTLFQCASAVLCRALLQEARRARIGCPFGLPPDRKPAPRVTTAVSPTKVGLKGNPFQDQVNDVEVRTARVLTERAPSATSAVKANATLDFIAILRDDNGEPEVQDASNVDSDSAASFCREAAHHARNADRRDLEECALIDLGISLQSGRKYSEALQSLQTALSMYIEDSNSDHEIKTYFQIALCYQKMERLNDAQEELQKALYRAQETANQPLIFSAHKYLGMFFLNTNLRQYATTHLALALLQSDNLPQRNYQRRLTRVLTGLAGANELMPEFVSLLRSTESPGQDGRKSMAKLLKWRENRTAFWSYSKTSRVVRTLEMTLPIQDASEGSSGTEKRRGGESSDKPETGNTPQTTLETNAIASQNDQDKDATLGAETDTLADVRTEADDELPEEGDL